MPSLSRPGCSLQPPGGKPAPCDPTGCKYRRSDFTDESRVLSPEGRKTGPDDPSVHWSLLSIPSELPSRPPGSLHPAPAGPGRVSCPHCFNKETRPHVREVWLSVCLGAQQPAPWGWTDSCVGAPRPPCLHGPPRSIPSLLPDGEGHQKSPGPQTFTRCPCSGLRESQMTWRVHSPPPSENHPQHPLLLGNLEDFGSVCSSSSASYGVGQETEAGRTTSTSLGGG